MSPKKPTLAGETTAASVDQPEVESAPWTQSVGEKRGEIVTAYERPEKGGVVYLRWTNPATGTYSRRATDVLIRDTTGRRVQARINRAVKLAEERLDELRAERRALRASPNGQQPNEGPVREADTEAMPPAASATIPEEPPRSRRGGLIEMTLGQGIARALRVGDGIFAIATDHARDTRRTLKRVLTVLGTDMLLSDFTAGTYRQLWRGLTTAFANDARLLEAQRRQAARAEDLEQLQALSRQQPAGGRRATEMAVIALLRVVNWLAGEHRVDVGATSAPNKWRKELEAEWKRLVPVEYLRPIRGARVTGTAKDEGGGVRRDDREDPTRYNEVEAGRLLIALPRADLRLRLAFELAGEGRLGQLTRTRRFDLRLSEGSGVLGLGFYQIEGRGTKPGFDVNLDAAQRAVTDVVMTTEYLADLEAGYQSSAISDYWLYPGGRLVLGRARTDVQVPMDDRTLNDLWVELERLAGVAHLHGRAHYGYRRISTDIAEDIDGDERVLYALFGHTPKGTRRSVYQNRVREEVAKRVTTLRRDLRTHFMAAAAATGFSLADVPEPEPLKVPAEARRGPNPRKGYRGWRKRASGES